MNGTHVLHRTDAKHHYQPLAYLHSVGRIDKLAFHQYVMRYAPQRAPSNLRFLAAALFDRVNGPIILGAEPFDVRIGLFKRLARKNRIIYHTSWPFWSGNRVPRSALVDKHRVQWREFVSDVQTVTVTKKARDAVESFGGSAIRIPHGVDTEVFSPCRGTTSDRPTVLFVGRLVEEKGIRDLLAAVEQMNQSPVIKFVGRGPLSSYLKKYNGPATVEYLGFVDDTNHLARLYATADLHVLPSYAEETWEELFGMVIIESMASGTPTVATDCVGPMDIVSDGETGVIVPQRDRTTLAQTLDSLLGDDEHRRALGLRARAVAVENYDLSVVADKWASVLDI